MKLASKQTDVGHHSVGHISPDSDTWSFNPMLATTQPALDPFQNISRDSRSL